MGGIHTVYKDIADRGGAPIAPPRRSRKLPDIIEDFRYALSILVERCFNMDGNARRVAHLYDKTAAICLGVIETVSAPIWLRNVSA